MESLVEVCLLYISASTDVACYFCLNDVHTFVPPDSSPVQIVVPSLYTAATVQLVSGDSRISSSPIALDSCFEYTKRTLQTVTLSSDTLGVLQAQLSLKLVHSAESGPSSHALDELVTRLSNRSANETQLRENLKLLQSTLSASYEARAELQTLIKESADNTKSQTAQLHLDIEELARCNQALDADLQKEQTTNNSLKAQCSTLEQENSTLRQELEALRQFQAKEYPVKPSLNSPAEFQTLLSGLQAQLKEASVRTQTLVSEKAALLQQLQNSRSQLHSVKAELARTYTELAKVKGGASSLTAELVQHSAEKERLAIENRALKEELQSLQTHFDRFVQSSKHLQGRLTHSLQALEEGDKAKSSLEHLLLTKESELTDALSSNDSLQFDLSSCKTQLEEEIAKRHADSQRLTGDQENLQQYYEQLTQQLKDELATARSINETQRTQLTQALSKHHAERQALGASLAQVETTCTQLTQEKSAASVQAREALAEVARLEQYLCAAEDLSQVVDSLQAQCTMHESTKQKLTDEMQSLSELVSLQSKRNKAANQKIFELTDQVNKQQETIRNLRAQITYNHYTPVRDDPVDQALANYLNSRDRPLDVPFERESPGIYSFGSKRVFVKIEQGNVIIRVGGGYMMIDEFIEFHTPAELEKLEGKEKRRHDSARVSLMDKYRETLSPRGDSELAPREAAKILREQVLDGKFTTMYGIRLRGSPSKGTCTPPMRKVKSVRRLSEVS